MSLKEDLKILHQLLSKPPIKIVLGDYAELDAYGIVHIKNSTGRTIMFMSLADYEDILNWKEDEEKSL